VDMPHWWGFTVPNPNFVCPFLPRGEMKVKNKTRNKEPHYHTYSQGDRKTPNESV